MRDSLRGTFFTVNLDQARRSFEKLPWVRHAEVRRQWPARLDVTIEEHKPVARWEESSVESRSMAASPSTAAAGPRRDKRQSMDFAIILVVGTVRSVAACVRGGNSPARSFRTARPAYRGRKTSFDNRR